MLTTRRTSIVNLLLWQPVMVSPPWIPAVAVLTGHSTHSSASAQYQSCGQPTHGGNLVVEYNPLGHSSATVIETDTRMHNMMMCE